MCFRIDPNGKAPKQKRAWKIVILDERRGDVWSMSCRYRWQTGEHKIPDDVATSAGSTRSILVARAGYYVFLDKEKAEDVLRRMLLWRINTGQRPVLMEVCIRPQDFLFRQVGWSVVWRDPEAATYRRVWVSERQPEIEWY